MKTLKRYEPLPAPVKAYMEEHDCLYEVGEMWLKDHTICRITKIQFDPKRESVYQYSIRIFYQEASNWEATEWKEEISLNIREFSSYCARTKLTKPVAVHHQEALDVMSGKISFDSLDDNTPLNTDTALIHKSSKESLIQLQKGMEERQAKAELLATFVGYEMEKRRQEMNEYRQRLNEIVASFQKKIEKIMRVIQTIELYLGINEELFQIQEGALAPVDTPITFRQRVLFIDEEIGHWKQGGLDFTNIDWFDEWLTDPAHLQQVFPEQKGVVVLRPRRRSKNYNTDDWVLAAQMNAANLNHTYFLIRNGDSLYRIFTDHLVIPDRLFPLRKELQDLMQKLQEELKEAEGWSNEDKRKAEAKDKVDDAMYRYKKQAILLQGLVDRSKVFYPLPNEKLNIFNLQDANVQFIYDDEEALPSGRLSFKDWWQQINGQIAPGSRVLITGEFDWSRRNYADRFYMAKNAYDGLRNVPDLPKEGVYEIEQFTSTYARDYRETAYLAKLAELKTAKARFYDEGIKKGSQWKTPDELTGSKKIYSIREYSDTQDLTVMYMPKAEASAGWARYDTHERKNRTRFKIFKNDDFIFNYDQVALDDVNFYLTSRVDRPDYLHMMPLLEKMKTHLLEEKKGEAGFVRLVLDRNPNVTEPQVQEAISWWKFKNQWKRSLAKDDQLALRMIEKKLINNLKK